MEFPCIISVKVFARTADDLQTVIQQIIVEIIGEDDLLSITSTLSSKSRYQAFRCKIRATERATVDELFTRLSKHPQIAMVL